MKIVKQNKYEKLINSSNILQFPKKTETFGPIKIEFEAGHYRILHLDFYKDKPQMEQVFYEILYLLSGNVSSLSLLWNYRAALRLFKEFMDFYSLKSENVYESTNDFDEELLLNFKFWLETRPVTITSKSSNKKTEDGLASNTKARSFRNVLFLLKKGQALKPELFKGLPKTLRDYRVRVRKDLSPTKDILTPDDLGNILTAAKNECSIIYEEYKYIINILNTTKNKKILKIDAERPAGYWKNFGNYVHSLIREHGILENKSNKINCMYDKYQDESPQRVIGKYVPVGEAALLPFALVLYITLGLNVSSVVNLTRDCIEDFQLPQFKKLTYDKPRSGQKRIKTQILPINNNSEPDKWSNPLEVLEFVRTWTEVLAENALGEIKNYLFIYKAVARKFRGKERIRKIPSFAAFELGIKNFISRNREKYSLPNFTLNDLRPAVATYLYLQTGDIFRVKRFLNHQDIKTTMEYIRGRLYDLQKDTEISSSISQMTERLTKNNPKNQFLTNVDSVQIPYIYDVSEKRIALESENFVKSEVGKNSKGVLTLIGRCINPLEPPKSLKNPKGSKCIMLNKCLNCTNAFVLESDLPVLLQRLNEIWNYRGEMSEESWNSFYSETWIQLNSVLSNFSNEAIERAKKNVK